MDLESLEGPDSGYTTTDANSRVTPLEVVDATASDTKNSPPAKRPKKPHVSKKHVRLALVILLSLLVIAGGFFAFKRFTKTNTQQSPTNVVINTQSLDNGTLTQVTGQAGGEVKQQLTISPDAIFKNDLAVQGAAEVTKSLLVNGPLDIQNAANIRDTLNVGKNLTVGGLITASSLSVGSITISSINVSGDLAYAGHIIPGGGTPATRPSTSAAGGTVTITGNDTSGTITITTGSGNVVAGELAILTFQKAFSGTPKVQLTPVNAQASSVDYFVSRTASFFAINTTSVPTTRTTYIFDYFVTQ